MVVGERFTKNGKTYVVSEVWGTNYGFREVEDLPVFEETVPEKEIVTEPKEEVKEEAPKKRVVRRKKA